MSSVPTPSAARYKRVESGPDLPHAHVAGKSKAAAKCEALEIEKGECIKDGSPAESFLLHSAELASPMKTFGNIFIAFVGMCILPLKVVSF